MAINIACPGCQGEFSLADDFAGKQVWCATCQQMISVPSGAEPVDAFVEQTMPTETVKRIMSKAGRPPVPDTPSAPGETVLATREAAREPPRPRRTWPPIAMFALPVAGGLLVLAIGVCAGGGGTWLLFGHQRRPIDAVIVPFNEAPVPVPIAPANPPMKAVPPRPAFDLTGTWVEPTGNVLSVRQIDNDVWWMAKSPDNGVTFVAVFHGQLDGDKLTGRFADVPAAKNRFHGSLTANVIRRNGQVAAVEGELTFPPENRRMRWSMSRMRGK